MIMEGNYHLQNMKGLKMCKLIVECEKCKKLQNSIKWKIKRNNKVIEKGKHSELCNHLVCVNSGLNWVLKQLDKYCECGVSIG